MSAPTTTEFDLFGPLPDGTTVLEASAGTGKTYTIVGLATRLVAEGVAELSELLLITFSRAAARELRERTRERFTEVVAALAGDRESTDPLVQHFRSEDPVAAQARLRAALGSFDEAVISTTHGFCQRMLSELGIAGEHETEVTVVEDVDGLLHEVRDDLFLRRYGRGETTIDYETAKKAARAAIFDPHAGLVPTDADGTEAGEYVAFAGEVRREVERRKRARGLRDYDDQIELLHRVLHDPETGGEACSRIRGRFSTVLVDEFQDTDPKQWRILQRLFHRNGRLVLVGDPKQAIYAFRGAEVLSYLDAVEESDTYCHLTTNWRSDADLVAALDHVYGRAALGDPRITVGEVRAQHTGSRLQGLAPLRVRYLPRTGAGPLGASGLPAVGPLRANVARDVADQTVRILNSDTTINADGRSGPVRPGHIAVLVRTHGQAALVYDALHSVGVPCVRVGSTNVFDTPAATQWWWLLQALEQPNRADRVRLAALTPLLGYTAVDLEEGGDALTAELSGALRELAAELTRNGFAAMFERLSAHRDLARRLLATVSGERTLTDLRHLAQLLDDATTSHRFGPVALTRWLEDRIDEPKDFAGDPSRRLESDAASVQILTVHSSKGLEFPVVFAPFEWDPARHFEPDYLLLHEGGRRVIDVGGPTDPGYRDRFRIHEQEAAGEDARLLYVALTRACTHVTMWWAPSYQAAASPLNRMLFGRTPGSSHVEPRVSIPADHVVAQRFSEWANGAAPITAEAVTRRERPSVRWSPPGVPTGALAAAVFDREVDRTWRRTSYSALTASAHDAPPPTPGNDEPHKADEPEEPPLESARPAESGVPSTMNDLPGGTVFGTLVHAVFEIVDTSASDLDAELTSCCREVVAERLSDIDPDDLARALLPVLHTPLGSYRRTLAEFSPADRLAELDFELPLAGGDDPVDHAVTVDLVADLLRTHLSPDDPMYAYADLIGTLEPIPLRGYLTGSIDAVLRTEDSRFLVVDYKTNRLAPGELTTAHYTREAMAAEMLRAHYPMQALLYSVALHRYLRWRLPGYRPDRHLGGSLYLFVRGMAGPDIPAGSSVFEWIPPARLITDLSDLLAGKAHR